MNRKQVKAILVDQEKRKKNIIKYICFIVLTLLFAVLSFIAYRKNNKDYIVNYSEDSKIDYKVYLKDNNYFEDNYLKDENDYIASLIDYVDTSFKYSISMDRKDVDYLYSYRIESLVSVKEANISKPLYTKKEELLSVDNKIANSSKNLIIKEDLNVDYNKYNNLIKEFVSVYGLKDIISTLTINMYIDVVGSCDDIKDDLNNESVISLVIPLTTKTVGIDIKDNLVNSTENILICKDDENFAIFLLLLGISFALIVIILFIVLVRYIVKTRTAENIYDRELKKILNYYHSYIQKVENTMDLKDAGVFTLSNNKVYATCQFYKIESFTDMLEIRDSINAPILMSSNETNTATYFIILNLVNKAVYIYGIRINDIKKQMAINARNR